jgi:mono/diheme cytochrome c family protein
VNLSRTNIVLAVFLLVVIASSLLIQVDHSRPNLQIYLGDDMTYSPAYRAYDPNQNFADGRTAQPPVPGTIARDEMPIHFEATPEGAVRAGEQLTNPYEPASEELAVSAERGAAAYRVFCTPCHGGGGAGDGPVSTRGFPPPPSLLTGKSLQMKDGQLFHILTYGQGNMPPFAAQLLPDRRWDLVNYVRSIQQRAPPATQSSASPAATKEQQDETSDEAPANEAPADEAPADDESPAGKVQP